MPRYVLPLLLAAGLSCGKASSAQTEATVRAVYAAYDEAMRRGDLDGLRNSLSATRVKELDAPDAREKLALAAAMKPVTSKTTSCVVAGDRATLLVEAPSEGGTAKGTIELLRERGAWRVDREAWTIQMAASPDPPETSRPMPPEVRALLDRVASTDPAAGAAAWTELSARYDRASAYLRDVREGLEDVRPVTFVLVAESFKGKGRSFHYFTAKPSASAAHEPVTTLGQALRYPLWQYEDAGSGGFKGGFAEWWKSYATARGLPR